MPRLSVLVLSVILTLLVVPNAAHAAPKRVVTLEWEYTEDVLALGVKPVGGADLNGYRTWVPFGLPSGITDVGTRQSPSIERIAKLRPDLIIVPSWRATKNLNTLKKISKVLVLDPYTGGGATGAQYVAMVNNFRHIGDALGQRGKAESIISTVTRSLRYERRRLKKAHKSGIHISIAQPGGTSSSPQLRMFTNNSLVGGIMQRLGMVNTWSAGAPRFGFTTTGFESLSRVQNNWFAFVYPKQYGSLVERFRNLGSYRSLKMVKQRHVRYLDGNTWAFGGPRSAKTFAHRLVSELVK